MKLIFGLGNPGTKYIHTRHNVGFLVLDDFLSVLPSPLFEKKSDSLILKDEKWPGAIFAKPQTFMNNSGKPVKELVQLYKIDVANELLIIHDDVDLPIGTARVSSDSSSAGHKGVQNIIDELGTQSFKRIRIGTESKGPRDELPTEEFVLRDFTEDELILLQKKVFPEVSKQLQKFLK